MDDLVKKVITIGTLVGIAATAGCANGKIKLGLDCRDVSQGYSQIDFQDFDNLKDNLGKVRPVIFYSFNLDYK